MRKDAAKQPLNTDGSKPEIKWYDNSKGWGFNNPPPADNFWLSLFNKPKSEINTVESKSKLEKSYNRRSI